LSISKKKESYQYKIGTITRKGKATLSRFGTKNLVSTQVRQIISHSMFPEMMSPEMMRRAIALALENIRAGGGPFAAIVVKDGRVLAQGVNEVTARNDPTAHAEIAAIRAACSALGSFQLTGCDLYATCEPCPMCLGAIYWARLARVFYAGAATDAAAAGFDDAFIYDELKRPLPARRIPMSELLREEGNAIFKAWATKADKTQY
jgi:guanine deaminase